jgi:hypothetical protein
MNGWLLRWARSRAVIVVAGIFFATLTVQSQSNPAASVSGCDQEAPPGRVSLPTTSGNQPGPLGAGTGAVGAVIQEVRRRSFPELARVDLRVRTFHSQSDYFRTRFSPSRFLLPVRMRYFIDVNPTLFQGQAPAEGICAVLAHELAHVVSLSHGNRIRRFALVRLLSPGYTARFERGTDLEAIHRGYGDGLKSYRNWVYTHIPPGKLAQKRRNYFSPEEIAAIQIKLQKQPDLLVDWRKHVPEDLQEIENSGK